MSYDPVLANRLGALATEAFVGEVFRATRERETFLHIDTGSEPTP